MRWRTSFIRRRTGFIRTADEASSLTDEASPPANKAISFGPYIFTKLAPSFLKLSFSSCIYWPKKVK